MSEIIEMPEGKRMSFLQLIEECSIEIPMIQRDYAQGREEEKEVRNTFLDSLYSYLIEYSKADLDFIYGSIINGNLTPLDGQQRLTTLFLLHWYLAIKDSDYSTFRHHLIKDAETRFKYKTRVSSKEFCQKLVENPIDLSNLIPADDGKQNTISKTIRNYSWYYSSWDFDPTVNGMLTMLDAIHYKFLSFPLPLYERLTSNQPAISFLFLDMEKSQLPEELYIKMNARGLPLTPFENFKAKLEQHIKASELNSTPGYEIPFGKINQPTTVQKYFSYRIDNNWSNLFWDLAKGKAFDSMLMNFIRIVVTNAYASQIDEPNFTKGIRLLLGKEDANDTETDVSEISFYDYKSINSLNDQAIFDLIGILDLIGSTLPLKTYLDGNNYINEGELIADVIDGDVDYENRVLFHGLYKYLMIKRTSKSELDIWSRVLHNLVINTIFNNPIEYSKAIIGLNRIFDEERNVIDLLKSDWQISGFNTQQVEEERIKAYLITKDAEWKSLILMAESHDYFKGQIGFILEYSGIRNYFTNKGNCDWSEDENNQFLMGFKTYYTKGDAIFDINGLRRFKDFLFERALLCKGDYLLRKGRNYSFLIRSDRDISWKRLLRGSFDEVSSFYQIRSRYFRTLLDSINIETMESDLKEIVQTELMQHSIDGWRACFIRYPATIRACNSRFVRFADEDDERDVLLLEKSTTSGRHRELFSFALKCYLEELGNKVDYVPQSSREQPKYISAINDKEVRISFEKIDSTWLYKMEYKGEFEYFETPHETIHSLTIKKITN